MSAEPDTEAHLELAAMPSPDDLAELRIRATRACEDNGPLPASEHHLRPFLVVTPHGAPCTSWLAAELETIGVRVRERLQIEDWARTATLLYLRSDDSESLLRAALYEHVWRRLFAEDNPAECWILEDESDLRRVTAAKADLRRRCQTLHLRARVPGRVVPIGLHAFHTPDEDRWVVESSRLRRVADSEGTIAPPSTR